MNLTETYNETSSKKQYNSSAIRGYVKMKRPIAIARDNRQQTHTHTIYKYLPEPRRHV